MNEDKNPYPGLLIDGVSGTELPNQKHQICKEGYRAGKKDGQVIKKVMKSEKGIVVVLDEDGEQMLKYQGQYEEVRELILEDAPLDAVFSYVTDRIEVIPREEW